MEFKTDRGILKVRRPNVLEVYDYISSIGSFREEDSIKLQKNMIAALAPYVDFSAIEGISCFDDLLNDPDVFFRPLVDLSDELYTQVLGVLKKKS